MALLSRTRRLLAALTLIALACAQAVQAQVVSDAEVKAAFLYNFAKFVQWPARSFARPDEPIVVGVLGGAPFADVLARAVAGKQVGGRGFVVTRFPSPETVQPCHLLFVVDENAADLDRVLARLRDTPTLIVGETSGFAARGGMINFTIEDKRVRFEINVAAIEHAGLKASSQLLNVARIVRDEPHAEARTWSVSFATAPSAGS